MNYLRLCLFCFSFLTLQYISAQCEITDVTAEVTACEDNVFDVLIDFNHQNTTNTFTISGNGEDYGSYQYINLPITLQTLSADCITDYEFIITDDVLNNCTAFTDLGEVCCEPDCDYSNISTTPFDCIDGSFDVLIDFDYSGTLDDSFNYFTYDSESNLFDSGSALYADLPIIITIDNTTSEYFYMEFFDNNNDACSTAGEYFNPCFDESACSIINVSATASECDAGNQFSVTIDFDANNVNGQFTVSGNGMNYGNFNYFDLPIMIAGFLGDCTTEYEFVITDIEDNNCTNNTELGTICCDTPECEIVSIDFGPNPICEGDLIVTEWFIFAENTSEVGFDIFIDNEFTTFVQYNGDGPYLFDVIDNGLDFITITACDNDNPDCCFSMEIENPCYVEEVCEIGEISVVPSVCDEGDQFLVVIDFEYANTSDQFTVVGNGMDYGVFNYAELPITIEGFLGDCMTTYEFIVSDINDNNCVNEGVVGPVCCDQAECEIVSIDFGDSPICSDGFIVTEWFIFGNNTSEVGYDIYINGEFLTFVDYNEEGPYIIEIENPGTQNFTITACDNDSETCCYTWDLENPCYEDEGECDITTLDFENTLDCVGGLVIGQWIIDGTGLSEVGFDVFVNEEFNQFVSYTENGIYNLELEVPNTEVINIAVCDNDNEQCCANITVDNPCYEEDGNCVISEILATANECNGEDQFSVVIDFEYGNTSDQFTVVGNGVDYGVFNYADLPITIEGFLGDCMTTYEFIVSDINDNNCVNEGAVGPICCNQAECEISSIDFGDTPICSDGFIVTEWFIFGNNTSEVGYDIYINGEFLTFVDYNEEGPYNIEIENPGTQNFTITACDNNSETCCYTWDLENPCYEEEGECDISTFDFENTLDCVGGLVIGQWIIDGTGLSEVGFDVFVNEEFNQFVSYTENGIYNLELEVPNTEVINIAVCDNDNEQCCANIIVDNPCYEEDGNCVISEILATANECNDADQFSVVIDFEYGNTSDQFSVVGNETDYGVFNYADLPITIEGFLGDCMTTYEFIVSDINDNNCVNEGAVGPICCNQAECEISSIDFGETPICSDGFIVADWYIFGVNTSEVGYDIYINEEFLTSVEYNGEGPYNFEIENPGTQNYTITACDNNTETCCYTWASQNPCYDEGDACDITTFDFENAPECIDGLLIADWLIEGVGISEIGFNIYVNEVFNQFVPYSDNSSYDFELEVPNTEVIDVMACDSANGQCCANITFPNPCYESPVGDCVIGELEAEVVLCEESEFELVLDFDYENTSNSFTIVGNGNEYGTFLYENLPISLNLVADCVTDIEFIVSDLEIDGCQSVLEFGPVCCEDFNGFDEIIINNTIDEELINFLIEISSQLLAGCTIEVIVGGESVAILSADDMTFDLGPYECNTDQVVMVELINSCSGETAEFLLDISDVDCTTSTEELSFSELIRWDSYTKILQALPDVQEALSCQIFAMDGRLVAESDLSVAGNIDLSGLPTGIYVARISIATGTGKLGIQKIFID